MNTVFRRAFPIAVLAVVIALVVISLRPQPVPVDIAQIQRGSLVVTVNDDGQTRIRERYIVSAPLSGRLVRIALKPGNEVVGRETLLTTIEPTDPELLDPRALALAQAHVNAAEARVRLASPRLESAKEAMNHAETELGRQQQLDRKSSASDQELNQRKVEFRQAVNDYNAAGFEVEIAAFELEQAKAALLRADDTEKDKTKAWNFPIHSPVSGRVLRVFQESSTVVQAGERILEVGDPTDLEVVVDILSTDAVQIVPGARVMLTAWGGSEPLNAEVRLVEPSAFTKVSALGIEEQRVNVIIDFTDPPESRPPLGDGFRVEADIVHWESDDVLTVPSGALFREDGQWAVFCVSDGQTVLRTIELGHRNDDAAEVLTGLDAGDRVILYPGDRVRAGIPVVSRAE